MRRYLLRRIVQIVVTLYLYLTLVFFILQAMPGDFSQIYIDNPQLDKAAREQLIRDLGLDKPLHEQYLTYLRNFVIGQWGVSFANGRPVWDIIVERLPRTALLFVTATLIAFYLGFLLGKLIAWRRGRLIEYTSTVVGITFYTAFTPMLALLLVWIFAIQLTNWTGVKLFPIANFLDMDKWQLVNLGPHGSNIIFGYMLATLGALAAFIFAYWWLCHRLIHRPGVRFLALLGGYTGALLLAGYVWVAVEPLAQCWPAFQVYGGRICNWQLAVDILHHMILPVTVVTLISFGGTMLLMRNSMLETIREDYVMAAKAKGLPDSKVRDDHAARNALLPVVTSFVLSLALAIDGGIITETLFSWPGMGLTLLNSVQEQDFPLAIAALVFTGVFALIAHLVADILYAYLDPRIRYE
jgi:peptide/nickel transport system permease protein